MSYREPDPIRTVVVILAASLAIGLLVGLGLMAAVQSGAKFNSSSCPGSNASALVVTEPREDGSAPGANPAFSFRSDARSSDGVGCSVNAPRVGGIPCFPAGAGFHTPRIGRSFRFGAFCHYLSAGRRLGAAYVLSKGLLKDPGAVSGPFPTGQSL